MEGNYLFTKWCKEKGYPTSYNSLKQANPNSTPESMDVRWEQICEEYEKDSFKIPDRQIKPQGGVITPKSFGQHLKKE